MGDVLQHPFTVTGTLIATVDEDSDQGFAQEIAVLAGTRRRERELVPSYGLSDPVFDQVDVTELNAQLSLYGPSGLLVTGIAVTVRDAQTQAATLTYDRS